MYYHVAPQRHRNSIATHGLDATREEADHNHVFDSLEAAKRYAPYTMLDMPYDIYEVNGEQHPWESDPMFNNTAWPDSDEPLTGAYRSTVPVPPENLKIVHSEDRPVPFERTADNTGGGWGGDAYPQETAEATENRGDLARDYMMEPWAPPKTYKWALNGTHISVGEDDHDTHFDLMGVNDFDGPHAWGTVEVSNRWESLWHIDGGNIGLKMIDKRIRRYCKDQQWGKATLTDKSGVPMESTKVASSEGTPEGDYPTGDWHHEDHSGDYSGADSYNIGDAVDEVPGDMPMICSECAQPFANYHQWLQHVRQVHVNPDRKPGQGPVSVTDMGDPDNYMPGDSGTVPGQEQYNHGDRAFMHGSVMAAKRTISAEAPPIPGPLPFIYDIDADKVTLGSPGQRHSDIHGQFTPGGVVEGLYLPDGKLQYRTDTDMPYTVRHMVQLWQAITGVKQTEKGSEWNLPVKHVYKLDNGKPYKIAGRADHSVAPMVRKLALSDDAVNNVMHAVSGRGNVYVVGGAVRDTVLGRVPKDVDLMVQGVPMEDLQSLLSTLPGRVDLTGKAFGVLRYKSPDGSEVEIALPRREQTTGEGHKDFDVQYDPYMSTEDDLQRRDFTGNAMAVNLNTGELLDPYGGAADLRAGKLRTVSPHAFQDDPLRTVRALSSVSRHGLEPDEETRRQMGEWSHRVMALPQERVQAELDKIMSGDDPERAIRVARDTGVLQYIMPELNPTIGFDQRNKHHRLPLDEHLLEVLKRTQEQTKDKDVRLAALMHDVGKPASYWEDDEGNGHYYRNALGQGADHQDVGADITQGAMQRLKYPTARTNRVVHLIRHHMFAPFDTPKAARRRINQVGADHIQDLLTLRQADQEGKGSDEWENRVPVSLQRGLAQQVMQNNEPTGVSSLAINGNDLKMMGMKPGPQFKTILEGLADKVIDDPSLNTRGTLLDMARGMGNGEHVAAYGDPVYTDETWPIEDLQKAWARSETHDELRDRNQHRMRALQDVAGGADLREPIRVTYNDQDEPVIEDGHHRLLSLMDAGATHAPVIIRTANILDPIHPGLDPAVFDDAASAYPKLKGKLAHWVTQHVYTTMVDAGWPEPAKYLSLILTGSLTTYQYSDASDFDVSLWVDVEHFPDFQRAQLIKLMIEKMDGVVVPGTTHPLQCFVVDPTKFTKHDLYKVGLRSGWDMDKKEWIVPPDKTRVHDVSKEFPTYLAHAKMVLDKFIMMTRYYPPMVTKLWHDLHGQRFRDMQAGLGDFSESNIAYKMIANYPGLHAAIERATGLHLASAERGLDRSLTGERWGGVLDHPDIGLYRELVPGEPLPPVNFTVFARLQLEGSWADVSAKARRLMSDGAVEIVRNTPTHVLANVQGDHGQYEVEISRHDPASQVIEQWSCTCPWNQYAWQRTRGWKKLEGRVCSHALAAYWQSRSTPLDVEEGQQVPRGQVGPTPEMQGQGVLPGMTPDDLAQQQQQQADMTGEQMPQEDEAQDFQQEAPPGGAPDVTGPTDMATPGPNDMSMPSLPQTVKRKRNPADALKNQMQLWDVSVPAPGAPVPATNPVSIPGAKPTSPTDPLNQLGTPGINTFSTVHRSSATEFAWHYAKDKIEDWAQELLARGQTPQVTVHAPDVMLEARGGKVPMPGAVPISQSEQGIPLYRIADLGYDPVTQQRMNADQVGPHGPGAPEDRGTFHPVPAGSRAEVVRVYPELKSMFVRVPLTYEPGYAGGLHPHHLEGFVEYPDVRPGRSQRTPFRDPPRTGGWVEVGGWQEITR